MGVPPEPFYYNPRKKNHVLIFISRNEISIKTTVCKIKPADVGAPPGPVTHLPRAELVTLYINGEDIKRNNIPL